MTPQYVGPEPRSSTQVVYLKDFFSSLKTGWFHGLLIVRGTQPTRDTLFPMRTCLRPQSLQRPDQPRQRRTGQYRRRPTRYDMRPKNWVLLNFRAMANQLDICYASWFLYPCLKSNYSRSYWCVYFPVCLAVFGAHGV